MKLRPGVTIFFIISIMLFLYNFASAEEPEIYGQTYEIIEPDFISDIEQRVANVDPDKLPAEEEIKNIVRNYRPDNVVKLPRVTKENSFIVDPTYTLPFDIPDGKGGIIYPAGFSFNPLDYHPLDRIIVVIDGTDEDQIHWFKNSPYASNLKTRLLLSDGNFWDVSLKLDRPVY